MHLLKYPNGVNIISPIIKKIISRAVNLKCCGNAHSLQYVRRNIIIDIFKGIHTEIIQKLKNSRIYTIYEKKTSRVIRPSTLSKFVTKSKLKNIYFVGWLKRCTRRVGKIYIHLYIKCGVLTMTKKCWNTIWRSLSN